MYCDDDDMYSILIYDAHHAYNVDDEHSMHIMMMMNALYKVLYSGMMMLSVQVMNRDVCTVSVQVMYSGIYGVSIQ